MQSRNIIPVTTEASPVRPPLSTPDALSTYVVTTASPVKAPTTVPTASTRNTLPMDGKFPSSSIMPTFPARPRAVASVPKKSLMKKAKMREIYSKRRAPKKSALKQTFLEEDKAPLVKILSGSDTQPIKTPMTVVRMIDSSSAPRI